MRLLDGSFNEHFISRWLYFYVSRKNIWAQDSLHTYPQHECGALITLTLILIEFQGEQKKRRNILCNRCFFYIQQHPHFYISLSLYVKGFDCKKKNQETQINWIIDKLCFGRVFFNKYFHRNRLKVYFFPKHLMDVVYLTDF